MRWSSLRPLASNRHSSTLSACSENSAKLTPSPSQLAPSGLGAPRHTAPRRLSALRWLRSMGPPLLEPPGGPVLSADAEGERQPEYHAREQDQEGLPDDVAADGHLVQRD